MDKICQQNISKCFLHCFIINWFPPITRKAVRIKESIMKLLQFYTFYFDISTHICLTEHQLQISISYKTLVQAHNALLGFVKTQHRWFQSSSGWLFFSIIRRQSVIQRYCNDSIRVLLLTVNFSRQPLSFLCQYGHCLYDRVIFLSTFACLVLSESKPHHRGWPSHFQSFTVPLFPFFICCIWHTIDSHLCFTCGLLFKEETALLCEWFCKKGLFLFKYCRKTQKVSESSFKLQREVVERLVSFWKTHKASDSCVREHRLS